MNNVVLIGRLTADPNVTKTQGEKPMTIARYTLAVDRPGAKEGQQTADFISCVAFAGGGDFVEKNLRKGTRIAITGRIQTGSYTNKDGNKVYTTDVVVDRHEFCESRGSGQASTASNTSKPSPAQAVNLSSAIDSDELPFS